jgi:hypothetical protein
MAAPDVTGFIAAQANLRSSLGSPVIFKVPVAQTWPEGTKINPDTGEPYDATIKPTSAAFTEVTKVGLVILKQASPLRPQADTQESAVGEMSGMDIIIDLAESDFADVENASEMIVNNLTYRVREAKPVGFAGQRYRRLIYGQER